MKTLLFLTDFYAEKVHFEKTSWNHTKWLSGTFLFCGNSNKCLLEQIHENSHCSVRWVGADNRSLFLPWSGLGWAAKFKFVWSDSLSCAFLTLHLFFWASTFSLCFLVKFPSTHMQRYFLCETPRSSISHALADVAHRGFTCDFAFFCILLHRF